MGVSLERRGCPKTSGGGKSKGEPYPPAARSYSLHGDYQPREVAVSRTASEGLARRSYKGKPAVEGDSTAGQYRHCAYKYGSDKAALQNIVNCPKTPLGEPVPLDNFPPLASHPGARSDPL